MEYDHFTSKYPTKNLRRGSVLITPDENPLQVFFLESGKIRKYEINRYGEKAVMNVFAAPSLLPLSWALNKTPNVYYFEAATPVTVRCIPTEDVVTYLQTSPTIVYGLLQEVYAGLENTQRRIAYLMRGSLRCRVLFELVIETKRSSMQMDDGSYVITVSETELAERAGLSRETVSRELAKIFKSSDICRRQGRSIIIKNLSELDALLQKYS
jgi:CRP-like cAMP-binding protein